METVGERLHLPEHQHDQANSNARVPSRGRTLASFVTESQIQQPILFFVQMRVFVEIIKYVARPQQFHSVRMDSKRRNS